MNYRSKITELKQGEKFVWPESDYGRCEIYRINNWYIVFAIPTYGGEATFYDAYYADKIDEMINAIESWT
jgi:hypothetical protein